MCNIRNAQKHDMKSIKYICEHSFSLTSLDVDSYIIKSGGAYFFEYYVGMAFEKYPLQFYVYEENNEVVGFIIYGVDNGSSISTGKKIGSIILLAVNETYQNKSIGYSLVKYVVDLFDKLGFDLITVGTDADNIAALTTYQKLGFMTILNWITLRYYNREKTKSINVANSNNIELKFENNSVVAREIMDTICFKKTNSLLYDKNISHSSILEKIKSSMTNDVANNNVLFYQILLNKTLVGFAVIRHDVHLSNYSEAVFQRIEDIHILPKLKENIKVFKAVINLILDILPFDVVEILLPSNRYNLINACVGNDFCFVHSATVLHTWRNR